MNYDKIRVILDDKTDVFRDIAIDPSASLADLHQQIYSSFGFNGQEMASFYTCDSEWVQDQEISLMDMGEGQNMQHTTVEEARELSNKKLIYVYDFMNLWTFFVEWIDQIPALGDGAKSGVVFSFGNLPDDVPEKSFDGDEIDEEDLFEDEFGLNDEDLDDYGFHDEETWN